MSEATGKDMDVAEVIKIFNMFMNCRKIDDRKCVKYLDWYLDCNECPYNYDDAEVVKAMSVAIPILEKSVKAD